MIGSYDKSPLFLEGKYMMTNLPRAFAGACLMLGVAAVVAPDLNAQTPAQKAAKEKGRTGELNAPPAKGERYADSLKVGAPAVDFTLMDPTGKKQVTLSGLHAKKPVVLIFGSCT